MNAYTLAVALHVMVAVLGLGQLTALAVVAARENATSEAAPSALRTLGRLTSAVTGSLVALLLTGLLAEWLSGWLFHDRWWFRIAFLLFLLVGAGAGRIRQLLRRASGDLEATFGRVRRLIGILSGLVALIVALMVLMPV
jgi:hypothetical protein